MNDKDVWGKTFKTNAAKENFIVQPDPYKKRAKKSVSSGLSKGYNVKDVSKADPLSLKEIQAIIRVLQKENNHLKLDVRGLKKDILKLRNQTERIEHEASSR